MKLLLKLCAILALFGSVKLSSQNQDLGNYSVAAITQDDGLSQGSNYFWFEDRKGFIWLTCNDALNRYDGSSVKVYNLKYFFKNCPTLQQGYGFAEDNNHLYIGSTRGLYIYDYQLDEFTLIDIYGKISNSKTAIPIGFADGKIWLFNEMYQLASFDIETKEISLVTRIPIEPLKSVHIYNIDGNVFYFRMPFFDKQGNICFVGTKELITYNLNSGKIGFPSRELGIGSSVVFQSAAYDKENDALYLGTVDDGLLIMKNNYRDLDHRQTAIKRIVSIAVDQDKVALMGGNSLFIYDKQFKNGGAFHKGFERIYNLQLDKIGRLWFCDDGQGEVIMDFRGAMLKNTLAGKDILLQYFRDRGVSDIIELPDHTILVNSMAIFNPKTFSTQKFASDRISYYSNSRSKSYVNPYTLELWMVENNLSGDQSKIIIFNKDLKLKAGYNFDNEIMGKHQSMVSFPDSTSLFSFSTGLYFFNKAKDQFEKIKSIPGQNSFYINILSNKRIAISYLNRDMILAKIEGKNQYKIIGKILPNVQCFYIQEDIKNKQFWVGTNQGVHLLDKNFKTIKIFDSNNHLAGTYIYGLLLDDFGKLWCSHQRGLSSIDTKTHMITNYDKEDGIQFWDFNNRAFLKASDGTLYFGGVKGLNYFKPPLKLNSFYRPEIYFDEILVNNNRYVSKEGINTLKELHLKYNENNISIKALIKDLEYGSQRKIMYRIKNIDKVWKSLSKKVPLNLNSLAPGTYEIEFGIADKFTGSVFYKKPITIIVAKVFYQTFLFWVIIGGFIFGGLIMAVSRWKFIRQQNEFKEKMALETQRNKITADLHDDIGSTLSSLQINSVVAGELIGKQKIEDAQKVLRNIENQSRKLSENMSDIVWSLKPNTDSLMTLSTRIRNIASEILGNTDIDYKIDIDEIIDDEIVDFSIKKNIILIVKEALNNIAKYSKADKVFINLKTEESNHIMEIKDNGVGFNPTEIKGNGIGNMKKRTLEMNGTFDLESQKGTYIKILIPKFRD
ncbi:histidine kinase [Chryseobacterium tructae]|uniref:ATP-binding protein n=1 Tax=Chryseobacterium tructae TaxID=1037380 RepID=A0ABV7XRD7_9FLAO|nr:ATP-binding protein [Chryseobacterium tructae]MDN3695050.1 histidine kinase [Chryseobacterium tructae]